MGNLNKLSRSRQGDAGMTIVVIIIILAVIIWAIVAAVRNSGECSKDSECPAENYCGADKNCHKIPIIEKTVINKEYNFDKAAIIIGIAMILTAIILRWKSK